MHGMLSSLGNAASPVLQFVNALAGTDSGQIETPEQREYLKNIILNRIRETGNLSGNELGHSDYDPKATWTHPDSLRTSDGLFSPAFAYQNTLGAAGFDVPEQGGRVNWKPSGTVYDFPQNLADLWGGFNVFNVINRGGLKDILIKDSKGNYKIGTDLSGNPLKGKSSLQHYTPDINITPEDIFNIFSGGGMLHKGEGVQDRPEISSYRIRNP